MFTTQRERRETRDAERARLQRLKIEWKDKLWLATNHVCPDSTLAWLTENRAEASKVGLHQWNLETLPGLVECQRKLRTAETFAALVRNAERSSQTVTVSDVLGSSPQVQLVEKEKSGADVRGTSRARRANAGKRQASRKQRTTTKP